MKKVLLVALLVFAVSFAGTAVADKKMDMKNCDVSKTSEMKMCKEKCGVKCCKECKACAAMQCMENDCKDCKECQGKSGKALKKAQKECMAKMKADCAAGCSDKKCKAECCKKDKEMKGEKAKKK